MSSPKWDVRIEEAKEKRAKREAAASMDVPPPLSLTPIPPNPWLFEVIFVVYEYKLTEYIFFEHSFYFNWWLLRYNKYSNGKIYSEMKQISFDYLLKRY